MLLMFSNTYPSAFAISQQGVDRFPRNFHCAIPDNCPYVFYLNIMQSEADYGSTLYPLLLLFYV